MLTFFVLATGQINYGHKNFLYQDTLPEVPILQDRNTISTDLIDSTYYWNWNMSLQCWDLERKNIFTYDTDGKIISVISFDFNGMEWKNSSQTHWTYDMNEKLTDLATELWDSVSMSWKINNESHFTYDANQNQTGNANFNNWTGSTWTAGYNTISAFDNNNNLISSLFQSWDSVAQSWQNHGQYFCTYDSSNNRIAILNQLWNDSLALWDNQYMRFFAYDIFNNIRHTLMESWNGNSWDTMSQIFSDFDAAGNKTGELWEHWFDSVWVNNWRFTYLYDADNNKTYYSKEFWDGFWIMDEEDYYTYGVFNTLQYALYRRRHIFIMEDIGEFHATYDWNNNMLTSLSDIWGNGVSQPHYNQHTYTYDGNDNRISEVNFHKYPSDSDSVHHYYSNLNPVIENGNVNTSFIFPNPSNGNFTVAINKGLIDAIEIFNLLGEKVFSKKFANAKSQYLQANLSRGLYFVTIIQNEKRKIAPLLIE